MRCSTIDFKGFQGVELTTNRIRLVITTEFGPRISFWGKPGEDNLLMWSPGKHFRKDWELVGGHRVWVTRPQADECEETYLLDTKQCKAEQTDSGWIVTAPINPFNATQRGIGVKLLEENKVEIDNFVVNTGDMLYSGGLWALTCTLPNKTTRYGIPIGDDNLWDFCKIVMFRRWADHSGSYNDDQFTCTEDMMVIQPKGKENKRMIQADKGIIAMNDPQRDTLFAKKVPYIREQNYPHGCNCAVYIGPDNFMVEMETYGSEGTLKPGESFHHKEIWILEKSTPEMDTKTLVNLFE
ncbi:MAG: hypothetical protein JXJ04_12315 [Spirochaetales bacterium]|nr:hypothetical protein [Spirochaetales bacterium]